MLYQQELFFADGMGCLQHLASIYPLYSSYCILLPDYVMSS